MNKLHKKYLKIIESLDESEFIYDVELGPICVLVKDDDDEETIAAKEWYTSRKIDIATNHG